MSKIIILLIISLLLNSCIIGKAMGDGVIADVEYRDDKPVRVENEQVKILMADCVLKYDEQNAAYICWNFAFIDKKRAIDKVSIYDVSKSPQSLLM